MRAEESGVSYILSCFEHFRISSKEFHQFFNINNINHGRKKQACARVRVYGKRERVRVYACV